MARIARDQCGVISLEQLADARFSYAEVRGLVKRGLLIRLHRGVFAVGHRPLLAKGYLWAALLAGGEDAFQPPNRDRGVGIAGGLDPADRRDNDPRQTALERIADVSLLARGCGHQDLQRSPGQRVAPDGDRGCSARDSSGARSPGHLGGCAKAL